MHEPHLGLLFAFLQLFDRFGDDLNGLSKKHLEFFFKDVLNLVPQKAVPDHAHLIFEVQKNLERYKLEKGTSIKDGKDGNKADIRFQLDEEIVVDKAKVESLMTLFLNPVEGTCVDAGYLSKSSPTQKAFTSLPWPIPRMGKGSHFRRQKVKTGGRWAVSQASLPQKGKRRQNHPAARMGFVLASPVLLLQEGVRTIRFSLKCAGIPGENDQSCLNHKNTDIFNKIKDSINDTFYIITEEALKAAQEAGLSPEAAERVLTWLQEQNPYRTWSQDEPYNTSVGCINDPSAPQRSNEVSTTSNGKPVWKTAEALINSLSKLEDVKILKAQTGRKIFSLQLSGEKEWIRFHWIRSHLQLVPKLLILPAST